MFFHQPAFTALVAAADKLDFAADPNHFTTLTGAVVAVALSILVPTFNDWRRSRAKNAVDARLQLKLDEAILRIDRLKSEADAKFDLFKSEADAKIDRLEKAASVREKRIIELESKILRYEQEHVELNERNAKLAMSVLVREGIFQNNARLVRPPVPAVSAQAKLRVLLVEDEHAARRAMETLIRREGYETHCAATYGEAMKAIEDHDFDVIVLDLKLPDGRGEGVLQYVRETRAATRVVVLTGSAETADLDPWSPDGVLIKPVREAALFAAIRGTVNQ